MGLNLRSACQLVCPVRRALQAGFGCATYDTPGRSEFVLYDWNMSNIGILIACARVMHDPFRALVLCRKNASYWTSLLRVNGLVGPLA